MLREPYRVARSAIRTLWASTRSLLGVTLRALSDAAGDSGFSGAFNRLRARIAIGRAFRAGR